MGPSVSGDRDATIDALRGMGVFTMAAANLAAETLRLPHPFWLRLYGSYAAPTFLLIIGRGLFLS